MQQKCPEEDSAELAYLNTKDPLSQKVYSEHAGEEGLGTDPLGFIFLPNRKGGFGRTHWVNGETLESAEIVEHRRHGQSWSYGKKMLGHTFKI